MSENSLSEIEAKIKRIESIGGSNKPVKSQTQNPVSKPKEYGSYQHFQSECMKKVDASKPDSPSRVEIITGKEGMHSTERLAECSILWGKHRNMEKPLDGLMNDLNAVQKTEKGEEL